MLKDAGFEDVIAEDRTDQVTLKLYMYKLYIALYNNVCWL